MMFRYDYLIYELFDFIFLSFPSIYTLYITTVKKRSTYLCPVLIALTFPEKKEIAKKKQPQFFFSSFPHNGRQTGCPRETLSCKFS